MQRLVVWLLVFLVGFVLFLGKTADSKDRHVQLVPHFVPGQTIRYRIGTETATDEHMTTPVTDNEQSSNFKQTTAFLIRLDVLEVQPTAISSGSSPSVHFRATFEESQSHSQTDAAPSEQPAVDAAIDNLQGHSFEFTLNGGAEGEVKGLDQITANRAAARSALAWIPVLANAGAFPVNGIEVGQKWTNEHPLAGFPLTGMVWRSESTYLRDESCAPAGGEETSPNAVQREERCAVVLTSFGMSRHGSEHSDATPEDYRRNGLRTSGKWTVTGESLNSVSLSDGFLVSSTQTASQDMDYEIVSAASGSRIHQVGHTKTETDINLVRVPTQVER